MTRHADSIPAAATAQLASRPIDADEPDTRSVAFMCSLALATMAAALLAAGLLLERVFPDGSPADQAATQAGGLLVTANTWAIGAFLGLAALSLVIATFGPGHSSGRP